MVSKYIGQSVQNHLWMYKRLPAMRETWVRFLGQEDPLEKEMANSSSIFEWEIPRTEKPGGLLFVGSQSST